MISKQSLCEVKWSVRPVGDQTKVPQDIRDREIPATVPGCVHTDLMAAGLIDDPYVGVNELAVQWIGEVDWQYRATFDADAGVRAHEHVELWCEGLDTIAEVSLNGQVIGTNDNMFVACRFDAKPHLKPTGNELVITFTSALHYALGVEEQLGTLPRASNEFNHPFNFIRKNACNFGWDWGPTLITAGVWLPLRLVGWSKSCIEYVRPIVTKAEQDEATVDVYVDTLGSGATAKITLLDPDGKPAAEATGKTDSPITLTIANPQRWWPVGHGDHPLYPLEVELVDDAGHTFDTASRRIGLRTSELDTEKDEIGRRFVLKVNGKPIYAKGSNWIPEDVFPWRAVEPGRCRDRLQKAIDANMNIMRIWGGGYYETDAFYDICDEIGLLVWQDFMFACAAYPEEEPALGQVKAEARHNVARLAHHASIVIYNGCNENFWGYTDWGWQKDGKLDGRTWGKGYYLDVLPKIVGEVDPGKPYWPGSPYSGDPDMYANDPDHGNKHNWEVWHGGGDYAKYRNQVPRFCSEYGFQGPANYPTLASVVSPEQMYVGSDQMKRHQKSPRGDEFNENVANTYFGPRANYDEEHYVLQVNQARAVQLGVEWFRAHQPRNMGAIYWSHNACWPVTCWACVDSDGRLKPLWYATRRFFADRLLTIQPIEGQGLVLFASNDSDDAWTTDARISRMTLDGQAVATGDVKIEVPPRSTVAVMQFDDSLATPGDSSKEMVVAHAADGHRTIWFFEYDKAVAYPKSQFDATLERHGNVYRLTLTARTFIRDLCISADRLDPEAVVSDQLITLLPGESSTLEITSAADLTIEQLTTAPVAYCANLFGLQQA
jgi:beta-mannosidase